MSHSDEFALAASERKDLEKLAAEGNEEAAFRLYEFSASVLRSDDQSERWLRRAAELGYLVAQYTLGYQLITLGSEAQKNEGLVWMQSAAQAGDIDAINFLKEQRRQP